MKIIKGFKEFAIKGNMFDMAIGIIIGASINEIISSLVHDIISPFLGLAIGKVNFSSLRIVLQPEVRDAAGNITRELVTVNYGSFLQVLIDFLIIVISIFIVIKTFNRLKNRANDEKDLTVPTPRDIELLSEIRDLLKK
ncbi:MAG: large-conductance mechanosensitive channel protein MscL [Bacteroidota bacterium]